jgi:hypothetical protein
VRDRYAEITMTGIWDPEGLIALLTGRRYVASLAHEAEMNPLQQRWRRHILVRP